ncbi:MAG: aminotransferase class I/II-fold pyridoxal phosphate-dependent enzyme, partial [Balneolaceae bacterium]
RAISEKTGVGESEIILAAGSESIISIICRTFFEDQDHAITADATFVGFFVQAGVRGVPVIKVPITESYKFDVDQILSRINERTKMVYIANPNNPTGTYIDKSEYSKLVNGIPDHVLLIADEAYYEYARDISDYPPALSHRKDNVIVLRTFSKAFGLAGFRIGYAIAHEALISQMMKTKLTFEPTTTAQAAALAAYTDDKFIQKSVDLVNHEQSKLYEFFDKHNIQYVKSISNSVIMIFDSNEEAIDFTQKMLEQGVILRRVNTFGLPNCVRITIGTEQEMSHFKESYKAIR